MTRANKAVALEPTSDSDSDSDSEACGTIRIGGSRGQHHILTPWYEAADNLDPKVLSAMLLKISSNN